MVPVRDTHQVCGKQLQRDPSCRQVKRAIEPVGMCTHDNKVKSAPRADRHGHYHTASRRRRGVAPPNDTQLWYHSSSPGNKTSRLFSPCSSNIIRNLRQILAVCVSGLAWALVIIRVLGPASSSAEDLDQASDGVGTAVQRDNVPAIYSALQTDDKSDVLHPNGSLSGINPDKGHLHGRAGVDEGGRGSAHAMRFLGKEAFPEQFSGWDDPREHEIPVAVNTVDVRPLEKSLLPKADILLAILSGDSQESRERRDVLRVIYDQYEGWVSVGGKDSLGENKEYKEMSFRVIFIVSNPTASTEGTLIGDVLYVRAPDGYRNIVHKVKHMMGMVRHVDFKYLSKADDDSFVCVKRLASFLHDQPEVAKDKIYAGVPTACNVRTNPNKYIGRVIRNSQDKWYDQKFVHHTLSGLDCFPVYMQGAFYVLAQPLVEHLYRGRNHYDTFVNEDVTIGSWLLGVDRVVTSMHTILSSRLWECVCAGDYPMRGVIKKHQIFFHNCKLGSELTKCSNRLQRPGLMC